MDRARSKEPTGRGSKSAIEKRRTARRLNALLSTERSGRLDGRTEKRRRRLLKELKEGRRGRALKPIDAVAYADELLRLGETIASLRKAGVKVRPTELTSEVRAAVDETQRAYGFRPEAWQILGIDVGAGKRRGRPPKRAREGGGAATA